MKAKLSFLARSVIVICMLVVGCSQAWAWNTVHLIGSLTGNNWDSNQKNYAFTNSSEDGKSYYEVSVTPGNTYYFAVYIDYYNARRGPSVENSTKTSGERSYANNYSWKITPTTDKIKIWSDQGNGHDSDPWIWVEETGTVAKIWKLWYTLDNTNWTDLTLTKSSGDIYTGTLSVNDGTTMAFKVYEGSNWYGNSGTMNRENCTGWTMSKSVSDNCHLTSDMTGTYTFNFDASTNKLSVVYPSLVTTTYNLVVNGAAQTENTTGSFTVDLTSAANNATVSFSINNETYRLATAAAITTNGTTTYTVGTSGTADLTLVKGLIYYFTVKSDGNVTVKAVDPSVTVENENSYYLIGNFMNTDGDNINQNNLIFRFTQTGPNTYTFDVPATLEVKSQIYSITAEGVRTVYGPTTPNTTFDISNNGNANYALAANSNCFTAHDRTLDSDGMYTYTLTVSDAGVPTSVNVKHTQLTRVAYYLPDAADATAQPAYSTRNNATSAGDNKYFGNVNLQENQRCFVISNIRQQADNDHHNSLLFTHNKLYRQGNGGGDVINRTGQPDGVDYTKVYPVWANAAKTVSAAGFTFGGQAAAYTLEYNPSKGKEDVVQVSENSLIGGEVLRANYGALGTAITSINIVGTGITGSFDLSTKVPMSYNQALKCYEYTFNSTSAESATNLFRFVANDSWSINWGEESTAAADQAKVPYQGTGAGHTAMPDDPNYLNQEGSWSEGSGKDIIFNRPAGRWTIRFYIVTESAQGGNGYTNKYYYTINGTPLSPYDVAIYGGRVLCSFSSDKNLEIPDGYRAYVAHSFTQKADNSNNTQDGCVNLYRIKYIPANMGVILYGTYTATNNTTVKVPFHDYEGELATTNEELWYNDHNGENFNNYLVAAPNGYTLNDSGLLDADKKQQGIYDYLERYFAFTWFSKTTYGKYYTWTSSVDSPKFGTLNGASIAGTGMTFPTEVTDYASFYRAKGTVGKNRAYLCLPKSVMDYNGQALTQTQDEDQKLFAKTGLRFDDFFYDDIDDSFNNIVTNIDPIRNVDNRNTDNVFYNIQGVKVTNPTKGLFIINGKKVLFK